MNIRIQHSKVSETVSKLQEIYKSRLEQEGEKHLSEIQGSLRQSRGRFVNEIEPAIRSSHEAALLIGKLLLELGKHLESASTQFRALDRLYSTDKIS